MNLPYFFLHDTATTEIYTLSLHDALPISRDRADRSRYHCYAAEAPSRRDGKVFLVDFCLVTFQSRSEEHTSELQSRGHLVCRLLLEKKKNDQQRVDRLRQAPLRMEATRQR